MGFYPNRPWIAERSADHSPETAVSPGRRLASAADVNDVRDLPRAGKLTDEEVAMINASYQRAIAAE
jgi:hypothetical protein